MYRSLARQTENDPTREFRKSHRFDLECRARILIGTRHYAGYLHNISPVGAKLRTISLIRRLGTVTLTLPDLRPIVCELRWNDGYNAGVEFSERLDERAFAEWILGRSHSRKFKSSDLVAELVIHAWPPRNCDGASMWLE